MRRYKINAQDKIYNKLKKKNSLLVHHSCTFSLFYILRVYTEHEQYSMLIINKIVLVQMMCTT